MQFAGLGGARTSTKSQAALYNNGKKSQSTALTLAFAFFVPVTPIFGSR